MGIHDDSRTRKVLHVAAYGIVLAMTSCIFPTGVCGCSPVDYGVYMEGAVTRAGGTPVPNAVVRANVFAVTCPANDSGSLVNSPATGTTDAQGRFSFFQSSANVATACVRVRVYADNQSGSLPLLSVERTGVKIENRESLNLALVVP